jgi:hypothetical protein
MLVPNNTSVSTCHNIILVMFGTVNKQEELQFWICTFMSVFSCVKILDQNNFLFMLDWCGLSGILCLQKLQWIFHFSRYQD